MIGTINWGRSQEDEKKSDALDMGGAHAITIGDIPSLERFQVHPNGKSRLKQMFQVEIESQNLDHLLPHTMLAPAVISLKNEFHFPNRVGRSRHGAPVFASQITTFTNRRSFSPVRPGSSFYRQVLCNSPPMLVRQLMSPYCFAPQRVEQIRQSDIIFALWKIVECQHNLIHSMRWDKA